MKVCAKCGGEFKNRGGRFCSTECSGHPSKNKRHGLCETPEYNSWTSMRERCNNTKRPAYQKYGARGITYCERWEVFENFLADMGPRPDPTFTLERIDNDGNYEPGNCKWGTKQEQSQNRRMCFAPDEDDRLREALQLGYTYEQMAPYVGWPKESCQQRASRLGLTRRIQVRDLDPRTTREIIGACDRCPTVWWCYHNSACVFSTDCRMATAVPHGSEEAAK